MGIVARQHSSSVDGFIADRHGDQPAIPAWRAPIGYGADNVHYVKSIGGPGCRVARLLLSAE